MLVRDSTGRWSDPVVLLIYSPLWAPFAWISWRLSTKPDSFIVRRVTILAANWALLCLALSSIFVFAVLEGGGNGAHYAAIPSVIACLQLLLLFSLAKAYFSLPRNRGDFYLLIPRLGGALLVGAIVLVVSSLALTPKRAFDEASSVGSLRTIYIAQKQFASDHVQLGFAPSLAQLGPTPGAELIDFLLASGTKKWLHLHHHIRLDRLSRPSDQVQCHRPTDSLRQTHHAQLPPRRIRRDPLHHRKSCPHDSRSRSPVIVLRNLLQVAAKIAEIPGRYRDG